MNEELSELLDETNRCLEKEGKVVVITYDSLDFCMDREVRGGLISELLAFWAENNLRYQGLRAKIFLRNDIFKKEVMLNEQGKMQLAEYRADAVCDLLQTGKILDEFDKTIFKSLVRQIKVVGDKKVEFEFECGIKVTESL